MQLAFVMPNEEQKARIAAMHLMVIKLRTDQAVHFNHLIRSWGVIDGRGDGLSLTMRAIKRTLRDKP